MRGILPTVGVALLALCAGCGGVGAAEGQWESLLPATDPARAIAGQWRKSAEGLSVAAATGARIALPVAPEGEYDFRAVFTRRTGQHSVGLVVAHGGRQVVFEADAWGQNLAGFQNLGGRDIRQNPTRRAGVRLQNGRRHTLTVEVRREQIRGLLDGNEIAVHRTTGADLSVPDVWSMPAPRQLGLVAWESDTLFHSVDLRLVGGGPLPLVRPGDRPAPAAAPRPATPTPRPTPPVTPPTSGGGAGRRVLMVIANYHFFYREYADPRAELERAGFRVTVAAGRRGACVPHQNSGEGPGGGAVQADIALSEVRTQDYAAVLFSGGWGASAYQYAFPGRYNDGNYNGDPATKAHANRIIGEFLAQDKYVAALCNAVSVLAWARVNGRSPLAGKRVCAPTRQAAAGIYNGRPAQPSCRWHPEANGAIMSPAGSIGRPGAADDVLVDGRIITGEDDISAREMGRRLVQVLSGR
jgi:putative intracellular protease/amidase